MFNLTSQSRPIGHLALAMTLLAVLVIQGCAGTGARPQVVEPAAPQQPSPQNIEMIRALNELSALKEELKLLRNKVEEIQFAQENADRRQQDLFQDVDRRLTGLEQSGQETTARLGALESTPLTPSQQVLAEGRTGSAAGAADDLNNRGVGDAGQAATAATGTSSGSTANGGLVDTVTVSSARAGDGGTGSVSLNEQDAYDAAFESLKQSRYQDAITQFQGLVNTWPDSELADDALYWMSEANYVNREFEAALTGFRNLVDRYPDSSRVPEAMLKVGYIQYDIGAYDQAAETFENILARFPGHQVTVSAETRLRRIKQTIQ